MSGTDYTTTPNLKLYKPIRNKAVGTWGDLWNSNVDTIDALGGPTGSFAAKAFVQDTPPANPLPGQLWFDSSNPQLYVWFVDPTSAQWVIATAYAGGLTTDAPSDGQTYGRQNGAWTNVAGSGSYLPISGATPMTGPLTLSGNATLALHAVPLQQLNTAVSAPITATGSTTPRSVQDRAADVANVKDFGAKGDGVTNDTAAIQAALNAVPAAGGTVFFPPGTYLVSQSIAVQSNTRLDGYGALISASSAWTYISGGPPNPDMFFYNSNWSSLVLSDHDITVTGLHFTYINHQLAAGVGGQHAIRFYTTQNVIVRDCNFQYGGDATYMIGCNNVLIIGNACYHQVNCPFDASYGPKNYRIIGNYCEMGAPGQFVNFNGLGGGSLPTGNTASGLVVEGNQFVYTDPATSAAINLSTLAATEACNDVIITNNILVGGAWINGQGNISNVVISNNVIIGTPSGGLPAIWLHPDGSNTPANINVVGNMIVGAQTTQANGGVIFVNGNNYFIGSNAVLGSAFYSAIQTAAGAGIVGNNNLSVGTGGATNIVAGSNNSSQSTDYRIKTGGGLGWLDASGFLAKFVSIGNTWSFYNTDASGALYQLFGATMHQTGSALNVWASLTFGQTLANFGLCAGAAAGSPPSITAAGSDTNIAMQIMGKGTSGVLSGGFQGAAAPTTAQIPNLRSAVWKNTTDGSVKLYYDDGGTLKSVTLT
jgi:hypothetical protein